MEYGIPAPPHSLAARAAMIDVLAGLPVVLSWLVAASRDILKQPQRDQQPGQVDTTNLLSDRLLQCNETNPGKARSFAQLQVNMDGR